MTSHTHDNRPFPLMPLLGAGGLVLISLLSVAWVRWFAEPADNNLVEQVAVVQARSFFFEDRPGGEVKVLDASTGDLVAVIAVGEHGFIRSTLRGMVRARRARGVGAETPFRVERLANGQLLLIDPVTDQTVDLWAFGVVNAQAFADFLDAGQALGAGSLASQPDAAIITGDAGSTASPQDFTLNDARLASSSEGSNSHE